MLTSTIAIRVSESEREKFRLLSRLDRKPISQIVRELVEKEIQSRTISASDLRKLPKAQRAEILRQMTAEALPVYEKYKDELFVDEVADGIE